MRYKRRKKNRIGLWILGLLILLIFIGSAGKINEKGNTADSENKAISEQEPVNEDSTISEEPDSTISEAPALDVPDSTPSEERRETTKKDSVMEVHFVDVGQGDCTLIICDGEAMIIDAGGNNQGTKVQLYLKKHGVEKLKYVVASHPDADHIGGLDVIIYKFECENILVPNCENDTRTYDAFIGSIKAKGYKSEVVDVGNRYSLGGASFEILSPFKDFTYEDTNNSSIILRIDHGENSFLFTGDALAQAQQTIIYDDELNADADVIKVPHHGANSGYMKAFYDEVTPEYAVISCGKDNSYGHPSASVLNELKSRKTKMFRTDLQGTVIAVSDTMNISFNVEPSDNWEPGDRQ